MQKDVSSRTVDLTPQASPKDLPKESIRPSLSLITETSVLQSLEICETERQPEVPSSPRGQKACHRKASAQGLSSTSRSTPALTGPPFSALPDIPDHTGFSFFGVVAAVLAYCASCGWS